MAKYYIELVCFRAGLFLILVSISLSRKRNILGQKSCGNYISNYKYWLSKRTVGFSDLVALWVIKIKKPMILCARSTSRSREQKPKSCGDNMRKVCSFYSHNNKIVWLSNMADMFVWDIHEVRKGLWAFILDCAFRVLSGWAGELWSHGRNRWSILLIAAAYSDLLYRNWSCPKLRSSMCFRVSFSTQVMQ